MKKLKLLLHKDTVINFPFLLRLMTRFWLFNFIIVSAFSALLFTFVSSQENIFQREIHMSTNQNVNYMKKLGEQKEDLTLQDIRELTESWPFQHELAASLLTDSDIGNFILTDDNGEMNQFKTIEKSCFNVGKCIVSYFLNGLKNHFVIKKNKRYNGFTLYSKGSNEETAVLVERHILKLLKKPDFNLSLKGKEKELKQVSERLSKKKEELDTLRNSIQLDTEKKLSDVDKVIDNLKTRINNNKAELLEVNSNISFYTKPSRSSYSRSEREKVANKKELESLLSSLDENIEVLKSGGKTSNDQIIQSLNKKRKSILKKLSKIKIRDIATLGHKDQDEVSSKIVPGLIVKKSALKELIKNSNNILDEQLSKRAALLESSSKNNLNKVSINDISGLVRTLEEKKVKLEEELRLSKDFLNFTVVNSNTFSFSKYSLKLTIFISIFLLILTLIISTITLYLFDKRVFIHNEIELYIGKVKELGVAPKLLE